MSSIYHCSRSNPVNERWFLDNDTTILFSECELCHKPLAIIVNTKTQGRISEIFYGKNRIEKLKKKSKNKLKYKDFQAKTVKSMGFVFGVNLEIHNCKGQVSKLRQKAKDFFGNQNLIKEIEV